MEIWSSDLTIDERTEVCEWINAAGYAPSFIRYIFSVEPALPGSVKLTFDRYRFDAQNKYVIVGDHAATDEFVIYASDRLGWLQHYLQRTGREHELAGS